MYESWISKLKSRAIFFVHLVKLHGVHTCIYYNVCVYAEYAFIRLMRFATHCIAYYLQYKAYTECVRRASSFLHEVSQFSYFFCSLHDTFMWLFHLTARAPTRAHHALLVCISIKKDSINLSGMFFVLFYFILFPRPSGWHALRKVLHFYVLIDEWNHGNWCETIEYL